ncbi:hypothetical protein [Burkholderia contaminans]|uniref:hypothetical protein n=1 Tax=Burkholderia contaminans TaxID=488447 RepID=UPI0008F4F8DF|nr:hypothetical protein [Burkholderia contaminans]
MRHSRIKFGWVLVAAAVAGCASDRIAGPAANIDTEIKALSDDVGRFTDQAKDSRATSNSDIASFNQMRGSFDAATAMLQAQWTIAGHSASARTLAQLDSLAGTPTAASTSSQALAAATSASSPVTGGTSKPANPVGSLAQVDQILQALSKPGSTKADFEAGASFVVATRQKLKADQAQTASAPGAAHAPVASGAAAASAATAAY